MAADLSEVVIAGQGLLSAYGIGLASLFAARQQALLAQLADASLSDIGALIDTLRIAVIAELTAQGIEETAIDITPILHIRYDGTDTTLLKPSSACDNCAKGTCSADDMYACGAALRAGR